MSRLTAGEYKFNNGDRVQLTSGPGGVFPDGERFKVVHSQNMMGSVKLLCFNGLIETWHQRDLEPFEEDHKGGYKQVDENNEAKYKITVDTNLDEVEAQLQRIEASLGRINNLVNEVQAIFSGNEEPLAFTKIIR